MSETNPQIPSESHVDAVRRGLMVAASAGLAVGSARGAAATLAGLELPAAKIGKTHVVESSAKTVRAGELDPRAEPAVVIESGDVVHYPNTWLNRANEPKYGMSFEEREPIRRRYPAGPYANIGPVVIRGAEPGDVVEIRTLKARPIEWGWNSSPRNVGAIPEDFSKPYLKYFKFDAERKYTEFAPGIRLELHPGQGMFATQPPGDKAVSAILNGAYGGKLSASLRRGS